MREREQGKLPSPLQAPPITGPREENVLRPHTSRSSVWWADRGLKTDRAPTLMMQVCVKETWKPATSTQTRGKHVQKAQTGRIWSWVDEDWTSPRKETLMEGILSATLVSVFFHLKHLQKRLQFACQTPQLLAKMQKTNPTNATPSSSEDGGMTTSTTNGDSNSNSSRSCSCDCNCNCNCNCSSTNSRTLVAVEVLTTAITAPVSVTVAVAVAVEVAVAVTVTVAGSVAVAAAVAVAVAVAVAAAVAVALAVAVTVAVTINSLIYEYFSWYFSIY